MTSKIVKQILPNLTAPIRREYAYCRRRYFELKRLRKLQRLRNSETPTGYSLRQFDENECIFVHIPKCAGVSISLSLFGNLGAGHLDLATYQRVFAEQEFNRYFKFTFVRNPWDRLVSAYLFLKGGGFHEADRKWAEENLSAYPDFDSFVRGWINPDNIHTYPHFRPQYRYLCTDDGRPAMDFIGYYENLEADFAYIQNRIGTDNTLLSLNLSQRSTRDYRQHYSEETVRIVADVYSEDISYLGYCFDNSCLEKQLAGREQRSPPHQNNANKNAPSNKR